MPYESVDALQRSLTQKVFHYAKDAKKAAGRALGTLVEIITFYLIKSWGYEKHTAIERRLPEYANPEITHNNACVLYEDGARMIIAYLGKATKIAYRVSVHQLTPHPFAVLECKRVGVEEGVKKGPQTIEKAKQGAYVARTVSSLQKIRMSDGSIYGVLHLDSGDLRYEPYEQFLRAVISSDDACLLRDFTLTVGVVSNHGNWFTSDDHNTELKVLAQSYDWLLFLTDAGLSTFVESLLVKPAKQYKPIKDAFVKSYTGKKCANRFTKVKIALAADLALQEYFSANLPEIEMWFNVISPAGRSITELKRELDSLSAKNWKEILS